MACSTKNLLKKMLWTVLVKVRKNVRYMPVAEATIGSMSIMIKYAPKMPPGPIPLREVKIEIEKATSMSFRTFLGLA